MATVCSQCTVEGPPDVEVHLARLVTTDASSRTENSPVLAVDPLDERHVVLVNRVDRPVFGCSVRVTMDGGRTWSTSRLPELPPQELCYAPDAVIHAGIVYVVYLALNNRPADPFSAGNDPIAAYVARSTDGGTSFVGSTKLSGREILQPRLAVDAKSGRLYVVYLKATPLINESPLGLGPPPNPIMAVASDDGGSTFSEATQVNGADAVRVGAPSPIVGIDHQLTVAYEDYRDDLSDYRNWALPYHGTVRLLAASSRDGGASFQQTVLAEHQIVPHRFLIYQPQYPALTASSVRSHLYVAWADGHDGAADILWRHSSDGGATWSPAEKLSVRQDGAPEDFDLPALAVDGTGRIHGAYVAYSGGRPTAQVMYRVASPGSNRFGHPVAVSQAFDASVGLPSLRDPGRIDLGTRIALSPMAHSSVYLAWADTGRARGGDGREDIHVEVITAR